MTADAALDTANAANTASIDAKTTANAISGQAVQATQAANRVALCKAVQGGHCRFRRQDPEHSWRSGPSRSWSSTWTSTPTTCGSSWRSASHGPQRSVTHFDIRVTSPKGQRRWSSFVAGYGPWPEAMVYRRAPVFSGLRGSWPVSHRDRVPDDKNHSTRFDLSNCMMRAH